MTDRNTREAERAWESMTREEQAAEDERRVRQGLQCRHVRAVEGFAGVYCPTCKASSGPNW